jgi:hypothetical protein
VKASALRNPQSALAEKNIALIFRRAYTAASPTTSPFIDDNLILQQGGDI